LQCPASNSARQTREVAAALTRFADGLDRKVELGELRRIAEQMHEITSHAARLEATRLAVELYQTGCVGEIGERL
jgi:hypothetical protein